MNEITKTFLFLLLNIMLVATIVEAIKKICGSIKIVENKKVLKTRLTKVTIIIIAIIFSVGGTLALYEGGALAGNKHMIIFYSVAVFVWQWFIDMNFVKKIIEKIIDKVINKI